MASEYKVVAIQEAVKFPSPFQWPSTHREIFSATLEDMLNQMSREGWEFVSPCVAGNYYGLIFRRDAAK
jgi:hypothetical protein